MKKQLIEFLGNAQCFCGGIINIIEQEKTVIRLDPNGMAIDFNIEEYKIHGECPICGEHFEIEMDGMIYHPVNRLKKLIPTLDTVQFTWPNPFGYKKNERV